MSTAHRTIWVARPKVRRRAWRTLAGPRPAGDLGRATRCTSIASRDASILLLVLVVVAILALGTNTYLDLMQTEHRAVRRHGRAAQALRLAESGIEYLKVLLPRSPAQIQTLGGLASNSTVMQAQLAAAQADEFQRGRFTIVCPAQAAGLYVGTRYGLENESAKLNLHALLAEGADGEARNRLLVLPGMTPDVADAILDWLDPDEMPRQFGAEAEYYTGLDPPYAPRNGPMGGLDELLLVRGVTPELLYGLDQNRNYYVDAGETPRGAMLQIDNAQGAMNRGWSAYLTISSVEAMGGTALAPLVDLNSGDLNALYTALKSNLSDEQAKFIILYRQYGQPVAGQGQPGQGQPGQGQPGQGQPGQGQPGQGGQPSGGPTLGGTPGRQPRENNGSAPPGTATVSAASIQLNLQQQGGTPIASMLDLVGASVQVPQTPPGGENNGQSNGSNGGTNNAGGNGGDNGNNDGGGEGNNGSDNQGGNNGSGDGGGQGNQPPPQTVLSPWQANVSGYRELLKLYDAATVMSQGRVAGRVNINAASKPVLLSIPYLPPAVVDQIISRRELEPNLALSDQRHAIWLLTSGVLQIDQMRQIERFITSRGDAFSGQSVGFFDGDPTPVRGEFILDRSVTPPRLRLWRDMTAWGPGFTPELLGAPAKEEL